MAASNGGAGAGLGVVARIDAHASGTAEDRRRAQSALERVVRRASASMRKRGWVVERLTELAPKTGAVKLWGDNLGAGKRVRLCVRQKIGRGRGRGSNGRGRGRANACASSSFRWIDEDQVFAVFLHELAHIERGPHDAKFYRILNELKTEAELRMADDFYVCGRCVGGDARAARASSPRTVAVNAAMTRRVVAATRAVTTRTPAPTSTRGRRTGRRTAGDIIEILDDDDEVVDLS